MKAKAYCNKQDCFLRKTFIGDTGEYSRNLCCNTDCELAKVDSFHPEATISGWVARTKKGELIFSDKPPVGKSNVIWHYREGTDVRLLSESGLFGNDIFPSLTWESNPLKVEITIKPKKA